MYRVDFRMKMGWHLYWPGWFERLLSYAMHHEEYDKEEGATSASTRAENQMENAAFQLAE